MHEYGLVDQLIEEFGKVDGIVSNAGILTVAGTTVAQNTQLSLDGCMFPQAS